MWKHHVLNTVSYKFPKHKPAGLLHELNSDSDSVPEEDEENDDDDFQNSQDDDCREEHELFSQFKHLQTAKLLRKKERLATAK